MEAYCYPGNETEFPASYMKSLMFFKSEHQSSYMTNGGFEKRLNIRIYDNMNGHRSFDMYQMINDFGSLLEYDDLNMFLRKICITGRLLTL